MLDQRNECEEVGWGAGRLENLRTAGGAEALAPGLTHIHAVTLSRSGPSCLSQFSHPLDELQSMSCKGLRGKAKAGEEPRACWHAALWSSQSRNPGRALLFLSSGLQKDGHVTSRARTEVK